MVLKFVGIDSINDAEPLKGCEIQIPVEERAPLKEGATYVSDLIGCRVFAGAAGSGPRALHEIGTVSEVIFGAGEAPILEIRDGKREHMVPLAQEYIKALDTSAKRIELDLPEGMLELDAPLSKEEKDLQKNSNS
jgi:16S rRNA processing protein RimM